VDREIYFVATWLDRMGGNLLAEVEFLYEVASFVMVRREVRN
jgi:hypothetical protein